MGKSKKDQGFRTWYEVHTKVHNSWVRIFSTSDRREASKFLEEWRQLARVVKVQEVIKITTVAP